jgi:ubiquinol-cytochrome c reductase cytochrome b subunit
LKSGADILGDPCGRFAQVTDGLLTASQYDVAVFDLVNFLTYIAEPMAQQRKHIGRLVLMFLALMFVFVVLLNREYWKGIH